MAKNKIVAKNKRKGSNKATGRDYTYDKEYQSTPDQIRKRVMRNKARRAAMKAGRVKKYDGKDVDHIKPLSKGGGNSKKNIRVVSKSKNRARK